MTSQLDASWVTAHGRGNEHLTLARTQHFAHGTIVATTSDTPPFAPDSDRRDHTGKSGTNVTFVRRPTRCIQEVIELFGIQRSHQLLSAAMKNWAATELPTDGQ